MRSSFWPHTVDTYDLFRVVLENPRIPKNHISRKFNVKNPKTGASWINSALRKQIIGVPVFRRKSFTNFREYFYFIRTADPHGLYENLISENDNLMYFCVQTGLSNFQIISTQEIDPKGEIVFSGSRSDYYVTVPPKTTLENSISTILKKLKNISEENIKPSPLVYHKSHYEKWDKGMESIYRELHNDMRKPFLQVIKNTGTYSNKIAKWMKSRDEFGQTIITYFPQGVAAYQLSTFCIETEYDSLLIDLFSSFPVSTIFYRLDNRVMMSIYLPYTLEGRSIVHRALSELRKKELVGEYTNSITEYHYVV